MSRFFAAPFMRIPHPVASRVVRATHILASQPSRTVVTAIAGLRLEVDPKNRRSVDSGIFHHGAYEVGTLKLMSEHIQPGDVVWDVGAYIGLMSLYAWRLGATVHAFEPNPSILPVLASNVERNGADVVVHPVALGALNTSAVLMEHSANAGSSYLAEAGAGIEVPVVPGRKVEAPRPTFMKVDVEGYETHVMEGMDILPDVMCVEWSPGDETTIPYLRSRAYTPFVQAGGKDTLTRLRPHRPLRRADNIWWFADS